MEKLENKNSYFLLINLSGWLFLFALIYMLYGQGGIGDLRTFFGIGLTYLIGFFLSIILRYIYKRINIKSKSLLYLGFTIIILSTVFAHLWYWSDTILTYYLIRNDILNNLTFLRGEGATVSRIPIFAAWSGLYFIIKIWYQWNQEKERANKADLLAHKAQLQMLRYQLNPHFLFNALNTIRALVEEDKEKAKEIITRLSEFLRYSLLSRNALRVPLREELEAIRHYFDIQKIRYEEKLVVNFYVDKEAEDFPVLSFLIYPLIENAVKYGMKTSRLPVEIELRASMSEDELTVIVSNTGVWLTDSEKPDEIDKGTGTGIENVKQRLKNEFEGRHEFEIQEKEGKVFVKIKIKK